MIFLYFKKRITQKGDLEKGFTFIEILIVVAIIMILTVFGLNSYNDFHKRRLVERVRDELKVNLRYTQNKALTNQKDCSVCGGSDDCSQSGDNVLYGWYANFSTNQIYGRCGGEIGPSFGYKKLADLDINNDGKDDFNINYSGTIIFYPLGGTNLNGDLVITISDQEEENVFSITISKEGDIY
ncbi:MAG: prepilin-type N-terminal cleavage/methylation domain-containing protein [Candidatus Omnitrophica bacterium]|nr:prepilin-type N-terminal cleavage/methylation domain-containing protein [Candidatus Omnitrophota bacterium]